ncbi:MAG: VCBS repeat-containing protein [Planctomycetes bacterium]|nr:VCBS repeat-containing protein [Planctomycetota bacterium]
MLTALVIALLSQTESFVVQPGVIPGPAVWTEAVCAFDADEDGDVDVVFGNGEGFAEPERALPPTLLINEGVKAGNPVFVDASSSALPARALFCKCVIAFDHDGDGDLDLLATQAYAHEAVLYVNNGRGAFVVADGVLPAIELNSWSACAGDVEQDGDLDLALAHHGGTTLFSGDGLRTQLWTNDGERFTDASAQRLAAAPKKAQQNVTFVDLDLDFDLDLVVDGRSSPQLAYLNDGTGNFTVASDAIPAGSNFTYETEFADLDGDTDLDAFYISLRQYDEGVATNRLAQTAKLGFDEHVFEGTGQDDNEAAFLDYDDDGDLDVLVGTLAGDCEKLWRNDGAMTFVPVAAFSALRDSTLDLALADFDGDGDVDVVTAQGESGEFDNRYYRNEGPRDTKPPRVLRSGLRWSADAASAQLVVVAQDGAQDDGVTALDVSARYGLTRDGECEHAALRHCGGGTFALALDPARARHVRVTLRDAAGNTTESDWIDVVRP